jgi:hypothetical protein
VNGLVRFASGRDVRSIAGNREREVGGGEGTAEIPASGRATDETHCFRFADDTPGTH